MKIAIQGHPTRGKEVIQILESLGGIDPYKHLGNNTDCYYEIHGNTILCACTKSDKYKYYTLEEFEEEFPFKIGDKVKHFSSICIIRKYCYINNKPVYEVESELGIIATIPVKLLEPYKEMKKERNVTLTLDKAKEWYKKGGELKEIALQAYSEEELTKVELPKSWEEFCDNYMIDNSEAYFDNCCIIYSADKTYRDSLYNKNICPSRESAKAHLAMIQLEQLRDCYRGLFITVIGMPVWCIVRYKGELIISKRTWGTNETFLSFQSPEIAEKYLKNFKPLIDQVGDLI